MAQSEVTNLAKALRSLAGIPIWGDVKLFLVLWLILPQFKGAAVLYERTNWFALSKLTLNEHKETCVVRTVIVLLLNLQSKHVVENVDMNKGWIEKATEESKEEENLDDGGDEQSLIPSSSSDELNKKVDDFIARVNRQKEA
ncbi:hypothetical protein JHK85_020579 [Glycine max]|nr:hypothetical protein JHK85_020579 [Glycine max]